MNVALTLIVALTLTLFGVAEAQEGKLSIFGHFWGVQCPGFFLLKVK